MFRLSNVMKAALAVLMLGLSLMMQFPAFAGGMLQPGSCTTYCANTSGCGTPGTCNYIGQTLFCSCASDAGCIPGWFPDGCGCMSGPSGSNCTSDRP